MAAVGGRGKMVEEPSIEVVEREAPLVILDELETGAFEFPVDLKFGVAVNVADFLVFDFPKGAKGDNNEEVFLGEFS